MQQKAESLSRDTRLKCALSLTISVTGDTVSIHVPDGAVYRGFLSLLEILSVFTTPQTLQSGLSRLVAENSRADWVETSAIVLGMVKAGVLVPEDPRVGSLGLVTHRFDTADAHISMLNDRARTEAYLKALRREVRPGDVVVDLGTGTGILATAAAKLGARRVYAIEAMGIASVARSLFVDNRVDDIVTLVEGRSTRVELPERADLVVSEIIGSEPLGERALEYTLDARRRFAKEGARFLPKRLRILAQALELPAAELGTHRFTPWATSQWRDWYGLEFGALLNATTPRPYSYWTMPAQVNEFTRLSESELLAEIDFETLTDDTLDVRHRFEATGCGLVNAIVVSFDLLVTDEHVITTRPDAASADTSWRVAVWLVEQPFEVAAHTRFELSYRHTPVSTTLTCVKV